MNNNGADGGSFAQSPSATTLMMPDQPLYFIPLYTVLVYNGFPGYAPPTTAQVPTSASFSSSSSYPCAESGTSPKRSLVKSDDDIVVPTSEPGADNKKERFMCSICGKFFASFKGGTQHERMNCANVY
jgi:hypothetical protein